jgi:prevent-host-death family protein
MIRINIHEAKTHLSKYLNRLAQGEVILLCNRNKPVAEIRPVAPEKPLKRRPIGLDKGTFEVTPAFFEPLPPEILQYFTGDKA